MKTANEADRVPFLDADQQQEGLHGKSHSQHTVPKGVSRRQLLASAAAMSVAGIVPGVEQANRRYTVEVVNVAEAPQQSEAAFNVSTVTARRLAEIAERNRIRAEARLPLLSIPRELRRMKDAADAASFREFAGIHMVSVRDEVLERVREARRRPNWRPTSFMEGLAFNSQVNKILHDRFNAAPEMTILSRPPSLSQQPQLRHLEGEPNAAYLVCGRG